MAQASFSAPHPLLPDGKGKKKKVWLVTAGEEDVTGEGEDGRKELREGGEKPLHLSQVRLGSQGSPKPFSFAKTRAEEAAGTEMGRKKIKTLNDKTGCG